MKNHVLGPFLTILVIFAQWRFFPKNPALSHATIYGPPNTMLVSEKTDEQTEGRTGLILHDPSGQDRGSNIRLSVGNLNSQFFKNTQL